MSPDATRQTRWDASTDLPIKWKWVGVGVSPQPTSKPASVEINGQRVALYWPQRGYGPSRVFFLCPLCGNRCRHVYELENGRMGCRIHVAPNRKVKEDGLLGLRRASVLARNRRYQGRARALQQAAAAKLASIK